MCTSAVWLEFVARTLYRTIAVAWTVDRALRSVIWVYLLPYFTTAGKVRRPSHLIAQGQIQVTVLLLFDLHCEQHQCFIYCRINHSLLSYNFTECAFLSCSSSLAGLLNRGPEGGDIYWHKENKISYKSFHQVSIQLPNTTLIPLRKICWMSAAAWCWQIAPVILSDCGGACLSVLC